MKIIYQLGSRHPQAANARLAPLASQQLTLLRLRAAEMQEEFDNISESLVEWLGPAPPRCKPPVSAAAGFEDFKVGNDGRICETSAEELPGGLVGELKVGALPYFIRS